jgi:hypothetical protein
MGELQAAGGVAHGVDPLVGGAQPLVDGHAAPVVVDARLFEVEPVDIHLTAHRDEEVGAGEAAPVLGLDGDAPSLARHGGDLGALDDLDALGAQLPQHQSGGLGSSLPSALAPSSTVTFEPRRRCACAISMPMGPPPMMIR